MELTTDEKEKYTILIDGILAQADLSTISEKRIRKQMSEVLEKDLTEQKKQISELIMVRFDAMNEAQQSSSEDVPLDSSRGVKREAEEVSGSDVEASPPKKQKKITSDAKLAAMLQAEEDGRSRPSRGVAKKPAPVKRKKTPKKKSAARIKGGDDSDLETGPDGEKKEKEKKGGFHKPYYLSESLQELVGTDKLARPQVVKKIWEHIKSLDLQDPSDKRQIRCDDKMQSVFKVERLHMFTMNKLLGKHLYPCEDETEAQVKPQITPEVKSEFDPSLFVSQAA